MCRKRWRRNSCKRRSNKGDLQPGNISDGNHISIRHADGSVAYYGHLLNGTMLNVGDTIRKGQVIGLSGNTGYSAFPHLHFEVIGSEQEITGSLQQDSIQTKVFYNLRPALFYKAKH